MIGEGPQTTDNFCAVGGMVFLRPTYNRANVVRIHDGVFLPPVAPEASDSRRRTATKSG